MSTFTAENDETAEYKMPSVTTLTHATKLAIVEDKPIINTSFDNLKIINQIIERQKPKEVAAAAPIRKPVQRGGLDADFVQEKLTIGKVLNGEKF